jgi:hypothetical protein
MSKSIALVSVHYYPDYQGRNARQIARIKKRIGISRHVGVLNGSRDLTQAHGADAGIEWVDHDNEGMEFGAYQRGLDALVGPNAPDWVIFMNDTIGTHDFLHEVGLRKLVHEIEQRPPEVPVISGYVVPLWQTIELSGLRGSRFVRSHFFAMNGSALAALNHRLRLRETDALIVGGIVEDTFFSAGVSKSLRSRLIEHCFRPELGYGWYRAAPLTLENCEQFAGKARSSLHECSMILRLEQLPALILDLRPLGLRENVFAGFETHLYFLITPGALRIAK